MNPSLPQVALGQCISPVTEWGTTRESVSRPSGALRDWCVAGLHPERQKMAFDNTFGNNFIEL